MSSSISSFEIATAAAWRKWLVTCAVTFLAAFAVLWIFLLLADPYDSGRFPGLRVAGVIDRNPRTANAGRGRSGLFNAALFGNSTGQLLNPMRLSAATALRFVQLTVPGTGPREQLTLLRWFLSNHPHAAAVVIVTDPTWCTSDPSLPLMHPFPFWLYGDNIGYMRHLMSWHAVELAFRRIGLALGLRGPVARTDGFSDYEIGWAWSFHPGHAKPRARNNGRPADAALARPQMSFPAIALLGKAVDALPASVVAVIVVPPVFFDSVTPPRNARITQCKTALAKLADRSRRGFLDFRIDNEKTRDPTNFMNAMHYRAGLAREMEQSISAVIGSAGAKRGSDL